MHATVQSDGRSPKRGSQLKSGSDNAQNTGTAFPSQVKGKKRERGDQGFEPIKRERSSKLDADFVQFTAVRSLQSEIVKITDRGGLADMEGVEKLVQLMLPEKGDRKIDLTCRLLLAGVIVSSDNFDCLSRFVQLRGLLVLNEWLQEVHKGKIGDGSSPKENDKSVEEFLLVLLRALDKLPVNLNALQMCNIGKSVNHLRTHKNLEIQKKARSLVDTWKKRVDTEMDSHDAKSGSSHAVTWPARPRHAEVSHCGNRHIGGSSEAAVRSSLSQVSAPRSALVKPVLAETVKSSLGPTKSMTSSASGGANAKDGQPRVSAACDSSDPPQTPGREEKSSSSSQSHNNSQSCSGDHAKNLGLQGKEDARSSTPVSMSVNKLASGASRHRKSINGYQGSTLSGVQRESGSSRSSLHRNPASEKTSESGLECEKYNDVPVAEGSSHKLIVKIPNRGQSPAQSAEGGTSEDQSVMSSWASSPVLSDKHATFDFKLNEKSDSFRAKIISDVKTKSWQSNDFKDVLIASDEGNGSTVAVPDEERCRTGDDNGKVAEFPKAASSSSGSEPKSGELHEASFGPMNASIESCVKDSEANASAGDDVGMNLLASVAAGEISKSNLVLPTDCSVNKTTLVVDSCTNTDVKSKSSGRDRAQPTYDTDDDIKKQSVTAGSSWQKDDLHNLSKQSLISSGDAKTAYLSVEQSGYQNEHKTAGLSLETNCDPGNVIVSASEAVSAMCSTKMAEDGAEGQEGHEMKSGVNADRTPLSKLRVSCTEEKDSNLYSVVEGENKTIDRSESYSKLTIKGNVKNNVNEGLNSVARRESKPPAAMINSEFSEKTNEKVPLPSSFGKDLSAENLDERQAENADEMCSRTHSSQAGKQEILQESNASPTCNNPVVGYLGSVVADNKTGCVEKNLEKVLEHQSGGSASQAEQPVKSREPKLTGNQMEEIGECAPTVAYASSISAEGGSEMDTKLKFDLNEGFCKDDGMYSEPINLVPPGCSAPVNVISPSPFHVSSVPSGLSASITVASAAKGPFLPPEDLLRSKGELGWKGSAVRSAFRPAEPRKLLEIPRGTTDVPLSVAITAKEGRPPLDFDLNVPDETVFADMASRNFAEDTSSIAGTSNYLDLPRDSAHARSSGGLDFDLNRIDEATDIRQCSTSNDLRLQVPLLPVKSSVSSGYPNGEVRFRGIFDLNDGPGLDEVSVEPSPSSQYPRSCMTSQTAVACVRTNNVEAGNFASWFPHGNTYSAVTIPSILPERGDQSFPIVPTGGSPMMLGSHISGSPLVPDAFRGQVLSSSPAFQYPIFPFGTSFPLPSATFPVGSTTYMDSSSGGKLCFPGIHTQSLGPAGAVSSHFPRPYIVRLPDGANIGGPESSIKLGKQGLDLNAGPSIPYIERRDEMLPLASRRLSVAGSQVLAEEMERTYSVAGGTLKRKDPEGGWDAERYNYKQSSYQ